MNTQRAPIELHLRIRVKDGMRDAFLDFMRKATPYYESDGQTRVCLLQDRSDPHCFIECMEYQTLEAYERGEQSVSSDPKMQDYLRRWRALLAHPPVVEVYQNITDDIQSAKSS